MNPYVEKQDPLITLGEMDNSLLSEGEFWAFDKKYKEYLKEKNDENKEF